MMKKGILLVSILLFLFTTSSAQQGDSDTQKWNLWASAIIAIPDGELRLDRGSRKVVEIDVTGGIGYQFGLEYLAGERVGLGLSLAQSRMEYVDKETFANGELLESSDQLIFTMISAEFNYHLIKDRRLDPYFSVNIGYTSYGQEMQITTELPGPDLGPDPSPELVVFELHKSVGIGLGLGLDYEVKKNWAIGLKSQIIVSNLQASIVNDPEDDGRDIDLNVNPVILNLKISRFF